MRKNFHFWVFCKYVHIPLICPSCHIYAVHSYAPVSSFVALILAPVAQWIERLFPKETVVGSTPIRSTSFLPFAYGIASLSTSRTPPRDLSNFTSTREGIGTSSMMTAKDLKYSDCFSLRSFYMRSRRPRLRRGFSPYRLFLSHPIPSLHAHHGQLNFFNLGKLPLLVAQRAVRARAQPFGDAIKVKHVPTVAPRD